MGVLRTLGAVVITSGTPTPIYTGPVVAAVSYSITNGIVAVVLGASNFPSVGYLPGQQVTLWGWTSTAVIFNGKVVTVLNSDPVTGTFRFAFNHANIGSTTSGIGQTAPAPIDKFRAVRIECGQSMSTHIAYVGDLNVSSSQYAAALTLAGQIAFVLSGDNIDASRIMVDGTNTGDTLQISVVQ